MNLLATLLLGHLIADFPLQTQWVYQLKTRSSAGVALHTAIHLVVTAVLIRRPLDHWQLLTVLGVAHYLTDWLKLRFASTTQTAGFLLDQAAHLATLTLLAGWAVGTAVLLPTELLVPALAYAMLPAVMTFLWVVANDFKPEVQGADSWSPWARIRVLTISKLAGLPLVTAITLGRLMSVRLHN